MFEVIAGALAAGIILGIVLGFLEQRRNRRGEEHEAAGTDIPVERKESEEKERKTDGI